MQVKEITPISIIICSNCGKQYTPTKENLLTQCSYCHKPFEEKPEIITTSKTQFKEKCNNCGHRFKPRKLKDNPVCPKCHRVI